MFKYLLFSLFSGLPSTLILTVGWLGRGPEAGGASLNDGVASQVGKQGH